MRRSQLIDCRRLTNADTVDNSASSDFNVMVVQPRLAVLMLLAKFHYATRGHIAKLCI